MLKMLVWSRSKLNEKSQEKCFDLYLENAFLTTRTFFITTFFISLLSVTFSHQESMLDTCVLRDVNVKGFKVLLNKEVNRTFLHSTLDSFMHFWWLHISLKSLKTLSSSSSSSIFDTSIHLQNWIKELNTVPSF